MHQTHEITAIVIIGMAAVAAIEIVIETVAEVVATEIVIETVVEVAAAEITIEMEAEIEIAEVGAEIEIVKVDHHQQSQTLIGHQHRPNSGTKMNDKINFTA